MTILRPLRTGSRVSSTSVFGMGVNRKDMDAVIEKGVPRSLEELVQMVGRARRDCRSAQGALE